MKMPGNEFESGRGVELQKDGERRKDLPKFLVSPHHNLCSGFWDSVGPFEVTHRIFQLRTTLEFIRSIMNGLCTTFSILRDITHSTSHRKTKMSRSNRQKLTCTKHKKPLYPSQVTKHTNIGEVRGQRRFSCRVMTPMGNLPRHRGINLALLLYLGFICLLLPWNSVDAARTKNRHRRRQLTIDSDLDMPMFPNAGSNAGLYPSMVNLAAQAQITANATCGENGPEYFCKLVEHVHRISRRRKRSQCDICSSDRGQSHDIEYAIDGKGGRWWQSPSINNGYEYHWVTITLDMKQVFQIAYFILKAANSPRPGNWILDKSLDGVSWEPWQYFAVSDSECASRYPARVARMGSPRLLYDSEVVCTSYFSQLLPLQNGEIHISLINGRPTAENPSEELINFTSARYVRLRFQRIRTLHADLMTIAKRPADQVDPSVTRRYFYSIKDISIGGMCICYGHAHDCPSNPLDGKFVCKCEHNTMGRNCEQCLPMYNQYKWSPGNAGFQCEQCNCNGRASSCFYDENVERRKESVDIHGVRRGGGVCINCTDFTAGINCDSCVDGYYRPINVYATDRVPCRPCDCNAIGTRTTVDGKRMCRKSAYDSGGNLGMLPGDCYCKDGYTGRNCDQCDFGFRGFPNCEPCSCDPAGSLNSDPCEGECRCKSNVTGSDCNQCKPGYYNLDRYSDVGCEECFCSNIGNECNSAILYRDALRSLERWIITDRAGSHRTRPAYDEVTGEPYAAHESTTDTVCTGLYYWSAPRQYLGKKLSSYGGKLRYTIYYELPMEESTSLPFKEADVILEGNGVSLELSLQQDVQPYSSTLFVAMFKENAGWVESNTQTSATKQQILQALTNIRRLLIRASYNRDGHAVFRIRDLTMDIATPSGEGEPVTSVEECFCPPGYAGLSCEDCSSGYYRRGRECVKCECNGHTEACNAYTGVCENCQNDTTGMHCELCRAGYYGDPTKGTCKRCACPLTYVSNNFSPTCSFDELDNTLVCHSCPRGHEGLRCERCVTGYFGNPTVIGDRCRPCECNGNSFKCDQTTGQCIACMGNTAGSYCDQCAIGYYGDAISRKDCTACLCDPDGSTSVQCHPVTGQCSCRPGVFGIHCDLCADEEYLNRETKSCTPCLCDEQGTSGSGCGPTGDCTCKDGVSGSKCDQCSRGYFNLGNFGCAKCDCPHTNGHCDSITGACICPPLTTGPRCSLCVPNAYGWDEDMGCKDCDCHVDGAKSSQCHNSTGACACREEYLGKQCDSCRDGYYDFPNCLPCACHASGTLGTSCTRGADMCTCSNEGQCRCKENVVGMKCNRCANGAFTLQDNNPKGCTKCFCFGITDECSQAEYHWGETVSLSISAPVAVANRINTRSTVEGVLMSRSADMVSMDPVVVRRSLRYEPYYWRLPPQFNGNKLMSYGGDLRFTIFYSAEVGTSPHASAPTIVVRGKHNGTSIQYHLEEPRNEISKSYVVKMRESGWTYLDTNSPVSREDFAMVLHDIEYFLIKASYGERMDQSRLSDVFLDIAVEGIGGRGDSTSGPPANGLEICECPPGYTGLSCEECEVGYTRIKTGMYLGECRPCACNGKSDMCEVETGVCLGCRDNFTGDRCNRCKPGFFLTVGPNGTTCNKCACPLSTPENNFSPTCVPAGSGNHVCDRCPTGYEGPHCERCSVGYYGDPTTSGGFCRKCGCNKAGSLNSVCDRVTGKCECIPGVTGHVCDECRPGHAITEEGCISCDDECSGKLRKEVEALTRNTAAVDLENIFSPPWDRLLRFQNRSDEFEVLLDESMTQAMNTQEIIVEITPNITVLNATSTVFKDRSQTCYLDGDDSAYVSNRTLHRLHEKSESFEELFRKSENLAARMGRLLDRLNEGFDISDAEVVTLFAELINQLRNRSLEEYNEYADSELESARKLMQLVTDNFTKPIQNLLDEYEAMKEQNANITAEIIRKMSDLFIKTREAASQLKDTQKLNDLNNITIGQLTADIEKITNEILISESTKNGAQQIVNETQYIITITRQYIEHIKMQSSKLTDLLIELQKESDKIAAAQAQLDDLLEKVRGAQDRAQKLINDSSYMEMVYNKISGLSVKQTDAATRYLRIAEAIESANVTARMALDLAMDSMLPDLNGNYMALLNEVNDMKKTVEEQNRSLKDMKSQMQGFNNEIGNLDKREQDLRKRLDNLDIAFPETEINLSSHTSKEANDITEEVIVGMTQLEENVKNMAEAVEISKKYSEIVDGVKDNLKQIPDLHQQTLVSSNNTRVKQIRVGKKNDEVKSKISDLRRQIEEARMKAASVRKASVKSEGKCSMRYLVKSSPSRITEVILQVMPEKADNTLFYLGRDEGDYVIMTTKNGLVHAKWELGSGYGEITNPVNVIKNKDMDKDWYQIEFYRMDQMVNLTVFRQSNKTGTYVTVSESSEGNSTILDVDERDYLFIGGVPDHVKLPVEGTHSFTGCMGEAHHQGKLVGMWNFREVSDPSHCGGCAASPIETTTSRVVYGYNGNSHTLIQYFMARHANTMVTVVDMDFKTLSSTGLLLYMGSSITNDFIAVEFENGRLVARINLGNGTEVIRTNRTYNNGQWYTMFLRRLQGKVRLAIRNPAVDSETKTYWMNDNDGHLNATANDLICVGGCPTELVLAAPVAKSGYIGCIRNFKLMNAAQPLSGSGNILRFSQVDTTCPKTVSRDIGIDNGGFVELPGHALPVTGSVSITFNSREPDALLLLATDGISTRRRRRRKRQSNTNFYSLSLSGGHVEARLRTVSGSPLILKSNMNTYSDGDEHTALLRREGDRIHLIVDENVEGLVSGNLTRGGRLQLDTSRLYVGGLPDSIRIKDMAGSDSSINGCVRELITDRIVDFKNATSVAKSYVGTCAYSVKFPVPRPRPLPVSTTAESVEEISPMPVESSTTPVQVTPSAIVEVTTPSTTERLRTTDTTGCAAEGELPTLKRPAVRFGQSVYSRMEFTHDEDISVKFRIQIEFKTVASHGLLLYSASNQHEDFFSLQLKNGKPVFLFNSGKGPGEAIGNFSVNDGNWHTIRISRSKRKGYLKVDDMRYSMAKSKKGANRMDVEKVLYIGGVSEDAEIRGLGEIWQSLDCCVRRVTLNKAKLDLSNPTMSHDLGDCYQYVEEGAYFSGKGYAIYSNEFRVGPEMTIELEFRTWARDGAIASISHTSRSDGLALELVNGSIVFRVDNGAGDIVAQYIPSDAPGAALCDGRWHKIKASKSKYLLTLTVDGQFRTNPETSRGADSADTEDPLYIGGCPDDAFTQKQLSTKAKFMGCIRKMKVKGQTVDFSRVYQYRDIYPNSCPKSSGT